MKEGYLVKNHIKVDNRLLQTNKKYSALKQNQKEWIINALKEEYNKYIELNNKSPIGAAKTEIIDIIYEKIESKGIWIPYDEVEANLNKKLISITAKMK